MFASKRSFFKTFLLFSFFLTINYSVLHAQNLNDYFDRADQLLEKYVEDGLVDYDRWSKEDAELKDLLRSVEQMPLEGLSEDELKAFWINTYNLLVIRSVVSAYPVQSPKGIKRFFDKKKHLVAGQKYSLNQIEKEKLLAVFPDGRLHFVLVCAAQGCPPIVAKAYRAESLEKDLEAAAKRVINDPTFVKIDLEKKQLRISKIFQWYESDFKEKHLSVFEFIKYYRTETLIEKYPIRFLDYDWTLNDKKIASGVLSIVRYRASTLIPVGSSEAKLFQSIYTQKQYDGFEKLNSRSSYYSAFAQYLYGLNNNVNIGGDLVFRSSVVNDLHRNSPFKTLQFKNFSKVTSFPCDDSDQNGNCNDLNLPDSLRNSNGDLLTTSGSIGLSHIGPKIKFNPIKKWSNISIQQTFFIPLQKKVDGQWISFTQFFYDQAIGRRSQIFVEASLWAPVSPQVQLNPFFKVFYSYFPTQRLTLYAMASVPAEYGLGSKFLLTENFELEALYSYYLPIKSVVGDTRPRTFNLGMRMLF